MIPHIQSAPMQLFEFPGWLYPRGMCVSLPWQFVWQQRRVGTWLHRFCHGFGVSTAISDNCPPRTAGAHLVERHLDFPLAMLAASGADSIYAVPLAHR